METLAVTSEKSRRGKWTMFKIVVVAGFAAIMIPLGDGIVVAAAPGPNGPYAYACWRRLAHAEHEHPGSARTVRRASPGKPGARGGRVHPAGNLWILGLLYAAFKWNVSFPNLVGAGTRGCSAPSQPRAGSWWTPF